MSSWWWLESWGPGGCRSKVWLDLIAWLIVWSMAGTDWDGLSQQSTWLGMYRVGCFHESIHPVYFVESHTRAVFVKNPTRISCWKFCGKWSLFHPLFGSDLGRQSCFFYHALLRWDLSGSGKWWYVVYIITPEWWQRCTWHKLLIADICQLGCSTLPTTFYQTKQNPVTTMIPTETWSWLIYRTSKLRWLLLGSFSFQPLVRHPKESIQLPSTQLVRDQIAAAGDIDTGLCLAHSPRWKISER